MLHGNIPVLSESMEEGTARAAATVMAVFTKLIRSIVHARKHLVLRGNTSIYRPEKHYMRGAGPKSRKTAPAGGQQAPKAT
jgi:hypothetical protein